MIGVYFAFAERERDLGREFRRVREQLELGIRRQFGALQEAFGKLIAQEAVIALRISFCVN